MYMYKVHQGRCDIMFWSYSQTSNPDVQTSRKCLLQVVIIQKTKSSESEILSHKLTEVEKTLNENHGSNYSPEQLYAWAHLAQMGKHKSMDGPPEKPFFGKRKKLTKNHQSSSAAVPSDLSALINLMHSDVRSMFFPKKCFSGGSSIDVFRCP